MSSIIYAAYGSNLDLSQMYIRCPSAEIYGRAELKDHELVFRGRANHVVATVEPQSGSTVPILLWSITPQNEKALDRYAGCPSFYRKKMMDIEIYNRVVSALFYVMVPGHAPGYPGCISTA